tara:strand:+ start:9761 stop:10549 length:789 start_codon:yes stop_codon:yes gene_type:complete
MLDSKDYKEKIALIVISCDNYSDLWNPFFDFFHKSWPDCPFKLHLITNNLDYMSKHNIDIIKVGEDISWSDNLIKGLDYVKDYDYVLLFLEDMLLNRKVENERIYQIFNQFFKLNGNFLSLLNEPEPTKNFNENFGLLEPKSLYRTTATATLWKKQVLLDILKPSESAWAFEKNGSKRSDNYTGFYSVYSDQVIWINAVIKNKWTYPAVKEIKRRGIDVDFSKRGKINKSATIRMNIYLIIRRLILNIIPRKFHRKLFQRYS